MTARRPEHASLTGKVALITGASSGIGEATAVEAARAGAAVALGARRTDRLESLADRLRAEGVRVLTLELDVTDEDACRDAVQRTRSELGGLDILVNNAGVMLLGPIIDADTEDWPRMISTKRAPVTSWTSPASPARVARSGAGVYNASTWAVTAFSESLRQEVTERGVRVSLVEPGAVETELTEHITHRQTKEDIERWYADMRALQAEDIAGAVLYVVTQPPHVAINELMVRPTDQVR